MVMTRSILARTTVLFIAIFIVVSVASKWIRSLIFGDPFEVDVIQLLFVTIFTGIIWSAFLYLRGALFDQASKE